MCVIGNTVGIGKNTAGCQQTFCWWQLVVTSLFRPKSLLIVTETLKTICFRENWCVHTICMHCSSSTFVLLQIRSSRPVPMSRNQGDCTVVSVRNSSWGPRLLCDMKEYILERNRMVVTSVGDSSTLPMRWGDIRVFIQKINLINVTNVTKALRERTCWKIIRLLTWNDFDNFDWKLVQICLNKSISSDQTWECPYRKFTFWV